MSNIVKLSLPRSLNLDQLLICLFKEKPLNLDVDDIQYDYAFPQRIAFIQGAANNLLCRFRIGVRHYIAILNLDLHTGTVQEEDTPVTLLPQVDINQGKVIIAGLSADQIRFFLVQPDGPSTPPPFCLQEIWAMRLYMVRALEMQNHLIITLVDAPQSPKNYTYLALVNPTTGTGTIYPYP